MSDAAPHTDNLDLSFIEDPEVRRAMRAIHLSLAETLTRQQLQIDAMLQMMIEKNLGSLADFKLHLHKLQQNSARSDRIHEAIAAASHAPVVKSVPRQQ